MAATGPKKDGRQKPHGARRLDLGAIASRTRETGTWDDRDFWSVVRLKPTNATLPGGRPKKFSGYALQGLKLHYRSFALPTPALAEADNARLASKQAMGLGRPSA